MNIVRIVSALLLCFSISAAIAADRDPRRDDTYTPDEIIQKGADFFGVTTESMAKAVERVFAKYGRPDAYIAGNEGAGAFIVGLRYGDGELYMKSAASPVKVYWTGPSIGIGLPGGNASKVFTLVYNLREPDKLFTRFPAVEGSAYVVAGLGISYQQSGRVILAPIRSGVGFRADVNGGYVSYSRERNWIPF